MAYDPKDNPLKDVRVVQPDSDDFDPQKMIYFILHGTTKGYMKQPKLQNLDTRQKQDTQKKISTNL